MTVSGVEARGSAGGSPRDCLDVLGEHAQRIAVAHVEACEQAAERVEMGDFDGPNPASMPFCGCDTCVIRETLHALWPYLEAIADGRDLRLPGR